MGMLERTAGGSLWAEINKTDRKKQEIQYLVLRVCFSVY